jgi:chorismate mutase
MSSSSSFPRPATGVPPTAPNADEAAATVIRNRRRIDEIDKLVIELIEERVSLSVEIQETRMASGGTQLSHSRENQIIHRYLAAFGRLGTEVAHVFLKLARGPVEVRKGTQ